MAKTKKAKLEKYQNRQLIRFINEIILLILQYGPTVLQIVQEYAKLVDLRDKARKILRITKESAFTSQIETADDDRDKIIITFNNQVYTSRTHYDPVIKEAARKVYIVSKRYKNMVRQEYNKESTSIEDLIAELRDNLMNEINILGLSNFLDDLEAANNVLIDLMEAREAEYLSKLPIDSVTGEKMHFEDVKKAIFACYRDTVTRIDAVIILNNTPVINEFHLKFNLKIDHYNWIAAIREGRNKARRNKNSVAVTGVTLDNTTLALNVGDTVTLIATILPDNATNKKVVWWSDDTAVVTVSETGLVTAIAAGTATVTVTTEDCGESEDCEVTVA